MTWAGYVDELAELTEQLDTEPRTQRTADQLRLEIGRFSQTWSQERTMATSGLGVPLPVPRRGNHPPNCDVDDAWLTFVFSTTGDEIFTPHQADFQMCVKGTLLAADTAVELEDHWRVDTHMYPIAGDEEQEGTVEPHAKYHFQRGGTAMDTFAGQVGYVPSLDLPNRQAGIWYSLMQNDGPRVPHLPMCPIVAIDYSLGQHDGHVLRRLREKPEYSSIVRVAQERLWVPFFNSLAAVDGQRAWLGALLA